MAKNTLLDSEIRGFLRDRYKCAASHYLAGYKMPKFTCPLCLIGVVNFDFILKTYACSHHSCVVKGDLSEI